MLPVLLGEIDITYVILPRALRPPHVPEVLVAIPPSYITWRQLGKTDRRMDGRTDGRTENKHLPLPTYTYLTRSREEGGEDRRIFRALALSFFFPNELTFLGHFSTSTFCSITASSPPLPQTLASQSLSIFLIVRIMSEKLHMKLHIPLSYSRNDSIFWLGVLYVYVY